MVRLPKYFMPSLCSAIHTGNLQTKMVSERHCQGPLWVLGPGFENHWCKLSSFLLRESIRSTVFLLFSSSALCGLCLYFTRTSTEGHFSLSPHLVYVFTTAHSHPPLNDIPSTVSTGVKLESEAEQRCRSLRASDRQGRLRLQSIENLSFLLCFDQCWILDEGDATQAPRL